MAINYTAFGQLIGPDGQVAAQHDAQPLNGFVPTSLWYPGQTFIDHYTLTVPVDAAPGDYPLHIGLYDLATLTRLPMSRDGAPSGDSVVVATVKVE